VPLADRARGPAPEPGRPDELASGLVRVTADNPGMMTGPGTNSYLVGQRELAVIDPGPDVEAQRAALLEAAAERGGRIRWILVTHSHADHAPGARPLAQATGAEVVGWGVPGTFDPDRRVRDGWTLAEERWTLRAVHTPGHARDHLCFHLVEASVLFSGDHVMEGSTVVIRPPDGDMAEYLQSLERLRAGHPAVSTIAPGHGRLIDDVDGTLADIVAHRRAREAVVVDALRSAGTASVDELVPVVYADVAGERHTVARASLWAHLRKLRAEGHVEAVGGDDDALSTLWRLST
jgi:glyoxylase-like metal-dependent hydrolase (beta-lactamase superfamily II)